MAQLPRRRPPHLVAFATALALLVAPAAAAGLELSGTWHVLVHYRDSRTANPEAERWEDRVWEFEAEGDRLRWTEFPLVIFEDETGRFERREGSGQYARVLEHWQPNAAQLANLRAGLAVNDRGSESKGLRRTPEGWSSASRASPGSAGTITYQSAWSIADPQGLPIFTQTDRLESESVESLDGRTELRTEQVLDGGDRLVGSFDRDGTRRGSFQMRRSGERKALPKRTQSELQSRAAARSLRDSNQNRQTMLDFARQDLADSGVYLSDAEIEALVTQGTELAMQGRSDQEIRDRLRDSVRESWLSFAPAGATHADGVLYRLPFDTAVARRLRMGIGGELATGVLGPSSDTAGHRGWSKYSFDFELPKGERILAARDGEVVRISTQFTERTDRDGRTAPSGSLVVLHADGTFAIYGHLGELHAETGRRVAAGDELGIARGPWLHLTVAARKSGEPRLESVPIRFDDGTPHGVVPMQGLPYGGVER